MRATRARTAMVMFGAALVGCLPDAGDGSSAWRGTSYGGDAPDVTPTPNPPLGVGFTSGPPSGAFGTPPSFGATVTQADPPPPLSGGTLAVGPDGNVVAADPDRDRVYLVDPESGTARTVALSLHDEPGRVAIDAANRAHVVLRRAGAIVTIDIASGTIVARQSVCPMPRGVAWEPSPNRIHVACAGGELVTFDASAPSGGVPIARAILAADLRDVVYSRTYGLVASTFRAARVLRVSAGSADYTEIPHEPFIAEPAHVAWRMIAAPSTDPSDGGDTIMVAQQKTPEANVALPGEYYPSDPSCAGAGPVTVLRDGPSSALVPPAILAVDVAATSGWVALAAAGLGHTPGAPRVILLDRWSASLPCDMGTPISLPGQITSVAFAKGSLVALSREPAALHVVVPTSGLVLRTIALASESREDTGHAIFHSSSGAGVACASCHPEGADDGHAWLSQQLGHRRTPSLAGTLANTAPYHWNGEAADLHAVAVLTFESRMQGPTLGDAQIDALSAWALAIPRPRASPPVDPAAASRGAALFGGAAGCTGCHSGDERTNNQSVNVATGGVFQVPPLVGVWSRAPYFHDGSAPTLEAALATNHGETPLTTRDVADLAAFLRTF